MKAKDQRVLALLGGAVVAAYGVIVMINYFAIPPDERYGMYGADRIGAAAAVAGGALAFWGGRGLLK